MPNSASISDHNDNQAAGETFGISRRALVLPIAANAALWSALAVWAYFSRGAGSQVFSLGVIVLAASSLGLVVFALARMSAAAVTPLQAGLLVRGSTFSRTEAMLPWGLIRQAEMKRGIGGRLAGSGTLVLRLSTGQTFAVADLASPDKVLAAVLAGWQREETEVLEALGVKKRRANADANADSGQVRRAG
ncbi:MAG: hypothetical protein WAT78_06220 [Rhizobiaceae bacterium]